MPSEEEMRDYDSIESESSPNMLGRNSHALTNGNADISNFEMNLANSEVENTRASAQSNNLSLRFVQYIFYAKSLESLLKIVN